MLEKLNNGHWLHVFPEGKINLEKEIIRLKWGVGRLIADCKETPIVLPFFHFGKNTIFFSISLMDIFKKTNLKPKEWTAFYQIKSPIDRN